MSNPTNQTCPSDITRLRTTDYRPNKALYENVQDNNNFRLYLQRNANKIREMQLAQFEGKMSCCDCESQPTGITPFNKGYSCTLGASLKR